MVEGMPVFSSSVTWVCGVVLKRPQCGLRGLCLVLFLLSLCRFECWLVFAFLQRITELSKVYKIKITCLSMLENNILKSDQTILRKSSCISFNFNMVNIIPQYKSSFGVLHKFSKVGREELGEKSLRNTDLSEFISIFDPVSDSFLDFKFGIRDMSVRFP